MKVYTARILEIDEGMVGGNEILCSGTDPTKVYMKAVGSLVRRLKKLDPESDYLDEAVRLQNAEEASEFAKKLSRATCSRELFEYMGDGTGYEFHVWIDAVYVPVWCVVRWVDNHGGPEDPDLTDPGPWLFTSEEQAVKWCLDDAEDCVEDDMEEDEWRKIRADASRSLLEDGRAEVDRGDLTFYYAVYKMERMER